MALKCLRHVLLTSAVLFFLVTPSAIYSCGPFLESAIFSFRDQPDGPPEDFAAGKLGILRPSFRRAYLVVAYRYLSGLKLTPDQQKAAIAVWNRDGVPEHPVEENSIAAWTEARAQVPDVPSSPTISAFAPVSPEEPYFQYLNCPGEAFQTAVKTLGDRSAKFGAKSADLREWVAAQDRVFVNCGGGTHVVPTALVSSDSLLRADRAYQIASASFYARSFDDALQEFDDIAKDASSPWASISPYLAARALIRKATLDPKVNEPFDRTILAEAQQRLEQIVKDPTARAIHDPAVKLLNYVRFRTEPAKRVAELDQEMLAANPGPNFKQDLWDYVLLLSHGEQAGDPSDWVQTYSLLGEGSPNAVTQDAAKHALDQWHKTKSLPWLVAALQSAAPGSSDLASLLADSRQMPASSPAYLTLQYDAVNLTIGADPGAARKQLDRLLAENSNVPVGAYNLFNDLRLTVTTSFDDFLQHAGERAVGAGDTGMDEETDAPGGVKMDELYLTRYSAEVFQKRLPLALLADAAASPQLTKTMRRDIARTTWVRSILLNDRNLANKLQAALQELDPPLWKSLQVVRTAPSEARQRFAALMVILQNPGLKPSARQGFPRSATLGEIDQYRDNWWCTDMKGASNWGENYSGFDEDRNIKFLDRDPNFPFPSWLSSSQKAAAVAEWTALSTVGSAPNYLTRQVLAYAKQNPDDPGVPQALHLAVRATRLGCTNAETSGLSKTAFEFLHQHYPQSEWSAKTKYYY